MRPRPDRRRRRGAALAEAAISIPLFLLMFLAIVDYGRLVMTRQLALNAARVGARLAVSSRRSGTTASIQAAVSAAYVGPGGGGGLSVSVFEADASGNPIGPWNAAGPGVPIAVQVGLSYAPLLPNLGYMPDPTPISVCVVMSGELN